MAGDSLSQEEFDRWLVPRDALAMLPPEWGQDREKFIVERLKAGEIRAAASSVTLPRESRSENRLLGAEALRRAHRFAFQSLWTIGDIKLTEVIRSFGADPAEYTAFGVRFEPNVFGPYIPEPTHPAHHSLQLAGAAERNPSPPKPGGRPAYDHWEDLIIAALMAWVSMELKPKIQADVERWMLDWLVNQGKEGGEAAVRPRARKVFQAIDKHEK